MKSKLWLLLAALLAASLLGSHALADVVGALGSSVTYTIDDSDTVTIDGTGPTYDFGYAMNLSPLDGGDMQNVEIGLGVTYIGSNVLCDCGQLVSVTIQNPEAVIADTAIRFCSQPITIHGWSGSTAQTYAKNNGFAFHSLGSLSGPCDGEVAYSFDLSTGTLTISGNGPMDFNMYCAPWLPFLSRIQAVVIEEGVTFIEATAFWNCKALTSVTIADSVLGIGTGAFNDCTNLGDITLPNGLTTIDPDAFMGCTQLTEVILPPSVARIGFRAFKGCTALKRAVVLNADCVIGDAQYNVFKGCYNACLYGWPASSAYSYYTNGSDSIDYSSLPTSGSCGAGANWDFNPANGSLNIGGTGAMADYYDLSSIPWYSFRSCIRVVTVAGGVTRIGVNAFTGCSALTDVSITEGVTSIGNYAFSRCPRIGRIYLPRTVSQIGYRAFLDCTDLSIVKIPNPEAVIGDEDYDVFENCAEWLILYGMEGSTTQVYAQAAGLKFRLIYPDPTFLLPEGLKTIRSGAFIGIQAEAVYIPGSVTSIAGDPFAGSGVQYIYGVSGTAAEDLAAAYGYTFVPVG